MSFCVAIPGAGPTGLDAHGEPLPPTPRMNPMDGAMDTFPAEKGRV